MTTEPARIEPGVYRLTRTVENPKPDKRSPRDWHKRERWAKDRVFVVFGQPDRPLEDLATFDSLPDDERAKLRGQTIRNGYQRIQCVGCPHVDYITPSSDLERWNALVPALEKTAETWEAFWMRLDAHRFLSDDFVRWLVVKGYIDREELEAEFAAWEDEPEDSKWRDNEPVIGSKVYFARCDTCGYIGREFNAESDAENDRDEHEIAVGTNQQHHYTRVITEPKSP